MTFLRKNSENDWTSLGGKKNLSIVFGKKFASNWCLLS
jgi:hypothetical protein